MDKKVGRNDPCVCGSGKKFKKCCEEKLQSKKFHAEVLTNTPENKTMLNQSERLNSFFKRNVAPVSPPVSPEEKKDDVT